MQGVVFNDASGGEKVRLQRSARGSSTREWHFNDPALRLKKKIDTKSKKVTMLTIRTNTQAEKEKRSYNTACRSRLEFNLREPRILAEIHRKTLYSTPTVVYPCLELAASCILR